MTKKLLLAFAVCLVMNSVLVADDPANVKDKQDAPMNEGEKLFRAMEEKILKAETVQVGFEGEIEGEKDSKWFGSLVSAEKNRMRLSLNGKIFEAKGDFLLVADGTNYQLTTQTMPMQQAEKGKCADNLTENLRHSVSRYTTFPMRLFLPLAPKGEARLKTYAVMDFKLNGKEKVRNQETNVITYTVKFDGKRTFAATLWIDAESQLPVKRTLVTKGENETMIEHFQDWKLGAKVEDKLFKLAE